MNSVARFAQPPGMQLAPADGRRSIVESFVPGLDVPIGELKAQVLNPAAAVGAGLEVNIGTIIIPLGLGFLWTALAIDSTGVFNWKMEQSGLGSFVDQGRQIASQTFSGDGVTAGNKQATKLWVAQYFPGGTNLTVTVTDTSAAPNTIRFSMLGLQVRVGSDFERDVLEAVRYMGMPIVSGQPAS